MDKPKKDILENIWCDILFDTCPTPDMNCNVCPVMKGV